MLRYFCLVVIVFISSVLHAKPYVINASEGLDYQLGKEKLREVMEAIYAPLGIKPEIVYLPSRRGLQQVNKGILDAEAGRIDLAVKQYTKLIPVPEPLSRIRLHIFCIQANECALNKNVGVLTIKGSLMAEQYCKNRRLMCNIVANDHSAFTALKKQHAPAIIANNRFAVGTLCSSGLQKIYIKSLTKPFTIYHYVSEKHANLVPKLTASIQHLMQTNTIQGTFQSLADAAKSCDIEIIDLDQPSA